MAGKVALITGITGQDGSYLTELLVSKGYTVSYCDPSVMDVSDRDWSDGVCNERAQSRDDNDLRYVDCWKEAKSRRCAESSCVFRVALT